MNRRAPLWHAYADGGQVGEVDTAVVERVGSRHEAHGGKAVDVAGLRGAGSGG